jgi:hypothetical protein
VAFAALLVGAFFAAAVMTKNTTQFDLDAFGKTAAYDEGRMLPLDSFARKMPPWQAIRTRRKP